MAFQICFVHDIKSIIVEHGIHLGLTGVVGSAHGVHIGLLHEEDVAQHRGHIYAASLLGMCVLRVDTLKEDTLSVDAHQTIFDINVSETVFCVERHLFFALRVLLRNDDVVEVRSFGCPRLELRQSVKGKLHRRLCMSRIEGDCLFSRLDQHSSGIEKAHFDFLRAVQQMAVVEFQTHLHRPCGVALRGVELCSDDMVAHKGFGSGHEINITMEAAHMEHVLPLEIGAVGPTNDLHGHLVFAGSHRLCDVKLGIVVRTLGVANVAAVDPDIGAAVDAIEVEEHILVVPSGGKGEGAAIAAHRIGVYLSFILLFEFDVRRFVLENVVYIDIHRLVIAFHFPAGGHLDVVPFRDIEGRLDKCRVAQSGIGSVLKLPHAVERKILCLFRSEPGFLVAGIALQFGRCGIRNERGTSSLFIDGKNGLVLPFGLCSLREVLKVYFRDLEKRVAAFLGVEHHRSARRDGQIARSLVIFGSTQTNVSAFFLDEETLIGVVHVERPQ